ncbi:MULTISPECIES: TRAP transporter small permease [Aminobacterium]|uniref:Tripartite ATP-independent periplasmic transporter DctQ component n=1 Tax=Aminobacterium colombiense (strain DSM 12261 / ALA-1) TaxID=572547 RepID=D5EHB2_AMICL|nr:MULTISPECIES: TRAP transporter small permease [Aminobacterium]MDD2379278.1 TRAP transporter small permease [Aminobacterium colombiense]ADE57944.1 Tripartite ATP-independent periplasmic transporter DctQ component [Aminobacterium colombiense DSM 12261]MDD3767853.1 TRAP transporter small permease [Aminobacterium colombiense]MDD4265764.1 TRAP transporter small permease [Aminobacterium colombiense]MDD4585192.1 TRAP transporter small permease [Aminobacterium colombiense]
MKALKLIDKYLEEVITILLFSIIIVVGIEQVITRYLFSFVHSWSEELMRVCFVLLSLVGFSLCEKKLQHVRVEVIKLILPPRLLVAANVFSSAVFLIFCLLVTHYSVKITAMQFKSSQITAAMGLPTWTYFVFGPFFFGLMAFRIIQKEILPLFRPQKESRMM